MVIKFRLLCVVFSLFLRARVNSAAESDSYLNAYTEAQQKVISDREYSEPYPSGPSGNGQFIGSPQQTYGGPPLGPPQSNYGPPAEPPQSHYGPPLGPQRPNYGPPPPKQIAYGPPHPEPIQ